jgi:cytochrome c-type biogenesis protein CcmH
VADSPTASAQEIRRQIDELLAGGASDEAVRDHFVARYGDWILLAPSSPLPWLIPLVVVVAGAAALVVWLAGRRRSAATPADLTPEQRRSLHEEVEAIDA